MTTHPFRASFPLPVRFCLLVTFFSAFGHADDITVVTLTFAPTQVAHA